jgi:anaerobic selenocysteine-containing dehydrogenase
MQVVKTVCGMCGGDNCGIDVVVDDGCAVDIHGMAEHPVNRGRLCPQARAALDLANDPTRLDYPLRRTGDGWQRITWDDALDIIAEKLASLKATDGAQALAVYQGRALLQLLAAGWPQRFLNLYGSPNLVRNDHMCAYPVIVSEKLTFGSATVYGFDVEHVRCLLLWGSNPATSHIPFKWRDVLEARRRGCKLIVVDPRRTATAAKADIHVSLRPGSDPALALGLLNVIIAEGLYDAAFVADWTVGFDQLAERVAPYTPERVAEITGVDAETIRQVARVYATTRPAYLDAGNALEHHNNSIHVLRGVMILRAITGNLDVPGGNVLLDRSPLADVTLRDLRRQSSVDGVQGSGFKVQGSAVGDLQPSTFNLQPPAVGGRRSAVSDQSSAVAAPSSSVLRPSSPLGADRYPLFYQHAGFVPGDCLLDAILDGQPYPVKALIVGGGNPVLTWPHTDRVEAALRKLELLVVMDLHLTATARHAHLVLPASYSLEQTRLVVRAGPFGTDQPPWHLMLAQAALDPVGERRSDWWFWAELGRRLGYAAYYPWADERQAADALLAPLGITADDLAVRPGGLPIGSEPPYRRYLQHGFRTPSGKVELYSAALAAAGQDPLPDAVEPVESPRRSDELAAAFPLVLTAGRRSAAYTHSRHHDLPSLRRIDPEPLAELHPQTAARYGVTDGDLIEVASPRGSIRLKARVTADVHPEVVSLLHGWEEANCNRLTDDQACDPVLSSPPLRSGLCAIHRIA